ncbi:MAG: hypothetical protein LBV45_07175 [Xanthomonadaceae bacterium]|nr:hypothetical protein [Xanthomonadaceae bacterium]
MKWFLMFAAAFMMMTGCGKNESSSLSQRTGNAVGGAATEFIAGLGQGVDNTMKVELDIDSTLEARGLTITLGKGRGLGTNRASIYVVSQTPFNGVLQARALDAEGREIGRANTEVELERDDAKYVDFQFDEQMDSNLVRKYLILVR